MALTKEQKADLENAKKANEVFRHSLKLHIRKTVTIVNKQYNNLVNKYHDKDNTPEEWEIRCNTGDVSNTEEWIVYLRNKHYLDILKMEYNNDVSVYKLYDYENTIKRCKVSELYPYKTKAVTIDDFHEVFFFERLEGEDNKQEDNSIISAYTKICEICVMARMQYGLSEKPYKIPLNKYKQIHNISNIGKIITKNQKKKANKLFIKSLKDEISLCEIMLEEDYKKVIDKYFNGERVTLDALQIGANGIEFEEEVVVYRSNKDYIEWLKRILEREADIDRILEYRENIDDPSWKNRYYPIAPRMLIIDDFYDIGFFKRTKRPTRDFELAMPNGFTSAYTKAYQLCLNIRIEWNLSIKELQQYIINGMEIVDNDGNIVRKGRQIWNDMYRIRLR